MAKEYNKMLSVYDLLSQFDICDASYRDLISHVLSMYTLLLQNTSVFQLGA
jgi:hypothetical protein